jgi:hypothetical protein
MRDDRLEELDETATEEDGGLLAWLFGSVLGQAAIGLVVVIGVLALLGATGAIAWMGFSGGAVEQLDGQSQQASPGSNSDSAGGSQSDVLGDAGVNIETNCVGDECEVSMDVEFGKADRIAATCSNPVPTEGSDLTKPDYNSNCVPQSEEYILEVDRDGAEVADDLQLAGGSADIEPLHVGSRVTVWAFVDGERYTLYLQEIPEE